MAAAQPPLTQLHPRPENLRDRPRLVGSRVIGVASLKRAQAEWPVFSFQNLRLNERRICRCAILYFFTGDGCNR